MQRSVLTLTLFLTTGCGGSDEDPEYIGFEGTLVDHVDPVTDNAGDNMFTLTSSDSGEAIAVADIFLTFGVPGGNTLVANFALSTDADGDGAFGAGDTLTGVEPPANVVGVAEVGTQYEVDYGKELEGDQVQILWSGTWTAN